MKIINNRQKKAESRDTATVTKVKYMYTKTTARMEDSTNIYFSYFFLSLLKCL